MMVLGLAVLANPSATAVTQLPQTTSHSASGDFYEDGAELRVYIERLYRAAAICVVCLLLDPQPLLAQQYSRHDWNLVRNLPPGTRIWVKTKAGHTYHGDLIGATSKAIQIDSDEPDFPGRVNRFREIGQQDVKQVRRFSEGKSELVSAGVGAALGAGIGLAVDSAARSKEDNGIAPVLFTLLGGLLGLAIGHHSTLVRGAAVYDAP